VLSAHTGAECFAGETGDSRAIPQLVQALKQELLNGAAAKACINIWGRHLNPQAKELMQSGCLLMEQKSRWLDAMGVFDSLTQIEPSYAEVTRFKLTANYVLPNGYTQVWK
jgi:hypothetical protein